MCVRVCARPLSCACARLCVVVMCEREREREIDVLIVVFSIFGTVHSKVHGDGIRDDATAHTKPVTHRTQVVPKSIKIKFSLLVPPDLLRFSSSFQFTV